MAGPTTQQLSDRLEKHEKALRDLEQTVQTLVERVDNARGDVKRIDDSLNRAMEALSKTAAQQAALEAKHSSLEKTIDEVKKSLEERDRKQWILWVAIIGILLTFVANLAVALLRK